MGRVEEKAKKRTVYRSKHFLSRKMHEIDTVSEWAKAMDWDKPSAFSSAFIRHYGEKPTEVLVQVKVQRAIYLLQVRPDLSCYEIALEIGKRDEYSLNKFLKFHTGLPPAHFKTEGRRL